MRLPRLLVTQKSRMPRNVAPRMVLTDTAVNTLRPGQRGLLWRMMQMAMSCALPRPLRGTRSLKIMCPMRIVGYLAFVV